ncbi:MAG: hypothetical protein WA021_01555 [Minisyncoccia bacterium]
MTNFAPTASFASVDALDPHGHDFLFLTQKDALQELKKRRKDKALTEAVHAQLQEHGAYVLKNFAQPRAVLFRQVATPTHETLRFLRLAKNLRIKPLVLEYYGDKFVSARNRYKRSLGKMPIYQHIGADGVVAVKYHTILDFPAVEGRPMYSVKTLAGEPLIAYHHRLLHAVTKLPIHTSCLDATPWFGRIGLDAQKYYEHVFMLFLRDGILFENYFLTKAEKPFVDSVIMPAFDAVSRRFGRQPLIVRLLPSKKELQVFWDSYPKKVSRLVETK